MASTVKQNKNKEVQKKTPSVGNNQPLNYQLFPRPTRETHGQQGVLREMYKWRIGR